MNHRPSNTIQKIGNLRANGNRARGFHTRFAATSATREVVATTRPSLVEQLPNVDEVLVAGQL